jgi:hypothetical protein
VGTYVVSGQPIAEVDLSSYLAMRMAAPKPPDEDRHARHIQRYYACRGLHKRGDPELYVRPAVTFPERCHAPEVVGRRGDALEVVHLATSSLDELPRAEIATLLADPAGPRLMLIVASVLDVRAVNEEFAAPIASGRLTVRVATLPPFDDVLDYDIWMFELTFQEVAR